MHQQGLFRVPGSVHEVNEFKQVFERGRYLLNIFSDMDSIRMNRMFRKITQDGHPILEICAIKNKNKYLECNANIKMMF